MKYDKIKKRPIQFLSITGQNLENFNFLLPNFEAEWDKYNDDLVMELACRLHNLRIALNNSEI